MQKLSFKDQCDECDNFDYVIGYGKECLCLNCILEKLLENGVISMDGLERIKQLSSEVTNKPLLKVVKYLLTRDDMNEKYLDEEKSLKQMVDYIKNEVRKTATDGWNCLEDEDVYNLAIHYWDETNESLKIKNDNDNSWDYRNAAKEIQEEKKEEQVKEQSLNKKQMKQWIPEGQLTLF